MPRPPLDLTGQRFGRLVAIECVGSNKHRSKLWLCKCDCGGEKITTATVLKRGGAQSCGCIAKELNMKRIQDGVFSHTIHGGCRTRLYYVWCDMRNRCECQQSTQYKWYGAKGVKVCEEWHDFAVFQNWAMENGYDPDAPRGQCTLDRIDPYGNYEPSNCRWVPMSVQRINRRDNYKTVADNEDEVVNNNA